ncbi:MAG: UDP-N-acetylmuramoyl-L-alanyl-D-glutamate--2,6-diaminopimelate ligase [Planctomycetota bacterium]|nr:UDP-N-acetylmuramoyl-L-alanyl-D-glutamate--2,6-diaminopimelate ligase [Planctomycetota bacterium]MDA1114440.1 UDP-N-acetylmuramoyl-L-alanyl-D-glutamate--2,6-diaminopimelate ligase [Planctomycetota bacterium]
MKVSELLHLLSEKGASVTLRGAEGGADPQLLRACFDSREVRPGDLFCALGGYRTDGRRYLSQALERGAAAFLLQGEEHHSSLPYLCLPEACSPVEVAGLAGFIAHELLGRPSEAIWVGAVTGTNGKSTVVHLLEHAMTECGVATACGGTLGLRFQDQEHAILNTTPPADVLHQWLSDVVKGNGKAVVLEASSIGLEQGRMSGVAVDCAAWTNLSHDHLDMHLTMEAYAKAKAAMFLELDSSAVALLPTNENLRQLCAETRAQKVVWGCNTDHADLRGNCSFSASGLRLEISGLFGEGVILSSLIGQHNAENLLVAFGMMRAAGIPAEAACHALQSCTAAPGRLQRVAPEFRAPLFVDYAHSPEALERVLKALRSAFPHSRIGVVFGAGGDRDKGKRQPMGIAAGTHADWCVVTSDNPRGENPTQIAEAVLEGVQSTDCPSVLELDRRLAIRLAVERLLPGDVLLLAGKGHETYQEINHVRHPFDDRVELREAVACLT